MSWGDYSFSRPLEWLGFGGKQATAPAVQGASVFTPQNPLESAASLANRRIRVIDPGQGQKSYDYLTHHLAPSDKIFIENRMQNEVTDEKIKALMQVINRLDYQALGDFKVKDSYEGLFPYIALAAVKKGVMSEAEFSTVMFYWSLIERWSVDGVKIVRLYDEDGTANEDVKNAILKTCTTPSRGPFATTEQIDAFFEKAKELPPSQQFIFVTNDHIPRSMKSAPNLSQPATIQRDEMIIRQVRYAASFNFFDHFISYKGQFGFDRRTDCEIMGSFAVYQTMGQVLFGENCVALRPTIGVSTVEEIQENARTDERDLGLPFPGVKLPKTADEFTCKTPQEFLRHDIGYHFWIASAVPSKHRKAIEVIANEVKQISQDTSLPDDCRRYLDEFYQRLVDMEFPFYRPDSVSMYEGDARFLLSLNLLISLTAGRVFLQAGEIKVDESGRYIFDVPNAPKTPTEAISKIVTIFSKHKILQRIAERVYEKKDFFKQEFGIDLFDHAGLQKINEEAVTELRTLIPAKFHETYDRAKPLIKWFATYAVRQVSLPQVLSDLRAKKEFEKYVGKGIVAALNTDAASNLFLR